MKYYAFSHYETEQETAKAISLTFQGGCTSSANFYEWFPKSKIIITDRNEVGNRRVLIPIYLFNLKRLDYRRCALTMVEVVEK